MTYQIKIPSCSYGGEGSIEKIKEIIAKRKIPEDSSLF